MGEPLKEGDLSSTFGISAVTPEYEVYEDDEVNTVVDPPDVDELEEEPDGYEGYITAEVLLPKGDEFKVGTVILRIINSDGTSVGRSNDNPILDTREYEVEFGDGVVLEYAANVIAENLYSQIDTEGNRHVLIDSIIDHKKDSQATPKDDEYVELNGKRTRRITTKGWKLCVQWKDGSTSWEPLKRVKESYPVEIAEYAVANKIASEPAFA